MPRYVEFCDLPIGALFAEDHREPRKDEILHRKISETAFRHADTHDVSKCGSHWPVTWIASELDAETVPTTDWPKAGIELWVGELELPKYTTIEDGYLSEEIVPVFRKSDDPKGRLVAIFIGETAVEDSMRYVGCTPDDPESHLWGRVAESHTVDGRAIHFECRRCRATDSS